jgi:hypothetical protein
MEQQRQDNREHADELRDGSSVPARDYVRWAKLSDWLRRLAATSKEDQVRRMTQVAEFIKANPGAERELTLRMLTKSIGSSHYLAEAEANLLYIGVESIPFDQIETSDNDIYLHYMGHILEAGELAAQRIQAAIDDYQRQLPSKPRQDDVQSEAATPSDEQSTKAAGARSLKEES